MLFAPLLHRSENVCSNPGGCRIGARPIDRIINGLMAWGIKVNYDSETGYYQAKIINNPKGNYRFETKPYRDRALMLIGLMTERQVVIDNIANEPLTTLFCIEFSRAIIVKKIIKLLLVDSPIMKSKVQN